MSGGIYRKRAYLLIRNRSAVKPPFIASIEYLRFGSFQSDFSEISHTVFFYFKWYRERKYSETKYYVSQCPLTLLITLAWTRRFQIIAKVLMKWRKLFIIKRWGETFYSERDWDETCCTAGSSSFSPIPLFSAFTPDKHSLDRLPTDRLPTDRLPTDRLPTDRLPTDRMRPKLSLISGH